jgi:hypothetical protein
MVDHVLSQGNAMQPGTLKGVRLCHEDGRDEKAGTHCWLLARAEARDTSKRTAFGVLPPHPELRRLEPLVGRWRAEEHTQDSVLGPGVPVTSTESSHWLEGGYSRAECRSPMRAVR